MLRVPKIVAFDVDGTLLRGPTVCQCLASAVGKSDEMERFEALTSLDDISEARHTMLSWYRGRSREELIGHLCGSAKLAPGARDGVAALRATGVKVALVSITWEFAVEWLRELLGADYAVGTRWREEEGIEHFWPHDKARWLAELLEASGLNSSDLVAVGDSAGDLPMLEMAGAGYFVGAAAPDLPAHVRHWPDADIAELSRTLIGAGWHKFAAWHPESETFGQSDLR